MLVYRLEDKEGFGPLSGRSKCPSILGCIMAHEEPPEMARKGHASHSAEVVQNRLWSRENVFAWNSLELMAEFARFPRQVDRAGFYVVVYETGSDDDVVTFKDGQVMFNREQASAIGGFWLSRALRVLFNEKD